MSGYSFNGKNTINYLFTAIPVDDSLYSEGISLNKSLLE